MIGAWSGKLDQILAGGNDFLDLYGGGRLAHDPGLYNPDTIRRVEVETAGMSGDAFLFSRPPVVAALLWPLARLPYRAAYFTFQALAVLAVALAVWIWPVREQRGAIALACCWSFPLSTAFANGQDIPFLLLWLSLAVRLMERRPVLAGLIGSLCISKFHLFLLLPIWIITMKRWRFGAGLLGGLACSAAASFALQGPDWIQRYLQLVRNPIEDTDEALMRNLHGLCSSLKFPLVLELALCGAVAWAVWRACRTAPENAWLATLAGSILVSRHAYTQDCAILLPVLVATLLAEEKGFPLRILAGILLLPVLYLPALTLPGPAAVLPAAMSAVVVMCWLSKPARKALAGPPPAI